MTTATLQRYALLTPAQEHAVEQVLDARQPAEPNTVSLDTLVDEDAAQWDELFLGVMAYS